MSRWAGRVGLMWYWGILPGSALKFRRKNGSTRKPEIANAANAAARRRMIAQLQYEDYNLYAAFMDDQRQATGESHIVRDSGRYPLCGRGDVNTYAVFAENMRCVIGLMGRVGCVVPSGIATDDTTKFFFQNVVFSCSLVSLFDFENRKNLFPGVGHGRLKFCLLTLSGSSNPVMDGSDFVFFAYDVEDLREENRHFILSAADIALFNPNTRTCPIFRSKRDMEITKAIYERVPVLIKEGSLEKNFWNISFLRMFDMANDSHLFRTREQLEKEGWKLKGNIFEKGDEQCLPLYEGKMTWYFDHRFGTYDAPKQKIADNGKLPELNEKQHSDPLIIPQPKYWIHKTHLPKFMQNRMKYFLTL